MFILRLSLVFIGLTGVIAVPAICLPWALNVHIMDNVLKIHGLPENIGSPLLEYWIYMFLSLNCVFGFYLIQAGLFPAKNKRLINLLAGGLVFIGIIIGIHGFRLGLPSYPFYGDFIICAIFGPLLLWLNAKYNKIVQQTGRMG